MSSAKSEDGEDNDFMGKLALSEITYTFKRINTHGKDIFIDVAHMVLRQI